MFANLTRSELTNAKLAGSNFVYAELTDAKIEATDFAGASFNAAFLDKTDLRHAKGLTVDQFRYACITDTTQFPEGFAQILPIYEQPSVCR